MWFEKVQYEFLLTPRSISTVVAYIVSEVRPLNLLAKNREFYTFSVFKVSNSWIYIAQKSALPPMRCMYFPENSRIFSRRLKLSVLSAGSRRSSPSEFQAVGPPTANARRPYELRRNRGTTNQVMTPRRTKMSTGHIAEWNAIVHQVPGSLVMKAVMHRRHELELHSFRHVEPMKVDMHKLPQTAIELSRN